MSTPLPSADRNLIFGLLALQLDFVTREQLLDAMHAWMLDKQTPLGEILCRRGILAEDEREVVELALQKHLQRHGGDALASLAALRIDPSMRQDLDRLGDSDVQTSVATLPPLPPDPANPRTRHGAADDSVAGNGNGESAGAVTTTPRFRRLREHARGGLGEVFVALDTELHREVALKEIRDRFADHPGSRGRFLREAEITGNLEHPGIVPVYGLGSYPDGRPFYAMRLVRGESMQEAIRRFHQADEDVRRDGGERCLALRDLLGRFVAVCNAVAYAHSRGVIHRDLKPANIMLGEYGETLVVDWGLARLLDRSEDEQGTVDRPVSTNSGSGTPPTQMGQAVGTPAFMPPEQAEGQLDRVGVASDVFSLGATLYAVLTGQAPYEGNDVLGQARRAEAPPARQRKQSVPAALEAVCSKAMSKKPEDRYASPLSLAEDVQRWLADERVGAYHEPLRERIRRQVKRHRTVATSLAVLLVTATIALAATLAFVSRAKRETENALNAESAALERSQASEKIAMQQRQLALQTVRRVVNDIHAGLKDRPGHKELRKVLLARALGGLREVARAADTAAQVDSQTIWVHFELGDIFLRIEQGGTTEAKKQYEIAHELARRLAHENAGNIEAQRDLSASYNKLGDVQLQLGDSKAARTAFEEGLELNKRLAQDFPGNAPVQRDLSISYNKLSDLLLQMGEKKAALTACQEGLKIREQLAKTDPDGAQAQRDVAVSHGQLGNVQMELRDFKAALAAYNQAKEGAVRFVNARPNSAQAQMDLALSYEKIGDAQLQLKESKAALTAYQQGLEVSERLAKLDAGSAEVQRELSICYNKLGDAHLQLEQKEAARTAYQQGVKIREQLAQADPTSAQAQRDLSVSYSNLGDVQLQLGDRTAARMAYQHVLEVSERLAKADPSSALALRDLIVACFKLGNFEQEAGQFAKAADWYMRGIDYSKKFVRPQVFSNEVGILERRFRICRGADETLADPAAALKLPESIRLVVLSTVTAALAQQKMLDKALAAADLLAANAKKPVHLYNAACAYALCVPLGATADAKEKLALHAVALLRQAVDKGYKNVARMKQDTDLQALRGRDDFKKLIGEMETAAGAEKANKH